MNYNRPIKRRTHGSGWNNRAVAHIFTGLLNARTVAASQRLLAATVALLAVTSIGGAAPAQSRAGSTAQFDSPWGVAVDSTGNVYVADSGNHTIRKITPAGAVSTFAGLAGNAGDTDGAGSAARFKKPLSIAIDTTGNLYVGDVGNEAIRKITPAGVVSTLAKAQGMNPQGIAVDSAGSVYVADAKSNIIRKVTSDGAVSTLAGRPGQYVYADGTGSDAGFYHATDVAVDSAGNLWVTDSGLSSSTIRKITPAGVVSTFAGKPGGMGHADGVGNAAQFWYPLGIAVDRADNLYVTSQEAATIRKVTPAGVVGTFIPRVAGLYVPTGIAVDAAGNLYVTEPDGEKIVKITPERAISVLAGSGRKGSADSADSAAASPKR